MKTAAIAMIIVGVALLAIHFHGGGTMSTDIPEAAPAEGDALTDASLQHWAGFEDWTLEGIKARRIQIQAEVKKEVAKKIQADNPNAVFGSHYFEPPTIGKITTTSRGLDEEGNLMVEPVYIFEEGHEVSFEYAEKLIIKNKKGDALTIPCTGGSETYTVTVDSDSLNPWGNISKALKLLNGDSSDVAATTLHHSDAEKQAIRERLEDNAAYLNRSGP